MRNFKTSCAYKQGIPCGFYLRCSFGFLNLPPEQSVPTDMVPWDAQNLIKSSSQNLNSFTLMLMLLGDLVNRCNPDQKLLLECTFEIWNAIKIAIDLRFVACTLSSEEWTLCRCLYLRFLNVLLFMTRILRISLYFGVWHKDLFTDWLLWCGNCFNRLGPLFSKAKFSGYLFINFHREMRCFISKDLDVKMCFGFYGNCVYGKILSVLKKAICTKGAQMPSSLKYLQIVSVNIMFFFSNYFQSNSSVQCSEL